MGRANQCRHGGDRRVVEVMGCVGCVVEVLGCMGHMVEMGCVAVVVAVSGFGWMVSRLVFGVWLFEDRHLGCGDRPLT
nr:hypothetical protein CFP56_36561 [Quercus suber]